MKNKLILFTLGIFLISIFLISSVYAAEVSYCCEKTKVELDGSGGAWCVNAPKDECDTNFRKVPTSCEATSYCKLGCCYNSQEGTCSENTPQKVCEDNNGTWSGDSANCDIPQCSLGCCLIGDQAAFVTQTRCKKLSSAYGLKTNFRTDIQSEMECILGASSGVKGACIFEEEYERTCLLLTKGECLERASSDSDVEFHEGYLCSSTDLNTNCGPRGGTTCVEGKDEVYFLDTCGNLANVYDSSKLNVQSYWEKIIGKADSCNSDSSNADNPGCGNCDYYLGSTCKNYERGQDTKPTYGDNICRDLSCEYDSNGDGKISSDEKYQHGESWCAVIDSSSKKSGVVVSENWDPSKYNKPGSRYFRLICYNNEVLVEPCADYRQEVCLQSSIPTTNGESFKTAACRVNMWQDCVSQDNEKDCENIDKRDCKWVVIEKAKTVCEEDFLGDDDCRFVEAKTACAPSYAPGFDFWNTKGDAESFCSLASTTVTVKYEEKFGKDKHCVEGCDYVTEIGNGDHVISQTWIKDMNKICTSLGDCGSKVNYIGVKGYESKQTTTIA